MSCLNWLKARARPTEPAPTVLRASAQLAAAIRDGTYQTEVPGDGIFGGMRITVVQEGILPPGCLGVIVSPDDPAKISMLMEPTTPPHAKESHLPA